MSSNKQDAYNNPMLSRSIEDRVKALKQAICDDPNYTGFDTPIAREAVLTSVTPGRTEWEATIQPFMCNKCVSPCIEPYVKMLTECHQEHESAWRRCLHSSR